MNLSIVSINHHINLLQYLTIYFLSSTVYLSCYREISQSLLALESSIVNVSFSLSSYSAGIDVVSKSNLNPKSPNNPSAS
jgi:hypothetical protein